MAYDKPFLDYLVQELLVGQEVSVRPMFGGVSIYQEGVIVGMVVGSSFYLKADDTSQADFAAAGCGPFMYHSKNGPVAMSYWEVPGEVLEDRERLAAWMAKSLAVAKNKKKARKAE